jgi:hypothetical protein
MISEEELKAIEARAKAGTMDPWMPGALTVTEFIAAAQTDIPTLLAEVRRLHTGLALAWSDGWQAAFDRPADAEEAIRFRDLKHFRDVQAILDGTTVD